MASARSLSIPDLWVLALPRRRGTASTVERKNGATVILGYFDPQRGAQDIAGTRDLWSICDGYPWLLESGRISWLVRRRDQNLWLFHGQA